MITIEINDDQVTAALLRLGARLADMTPVMGRVALKLEGNAEDRFGAQVSPEGAAWAPRSPVTLERYLASGEGFGGILHRTGRLRTTLGTDFGPDFAEVSSAAVQAGVMQFGAAQGAFGRGARGGPLPWGTIPARPFLGFSDKDRADILALVEVWLAETAGGP